MLPIQSRGKGGQAGAGREPDSRSPGPRAPVMRKKITASFRARRSSFIVLSGSRDAIATRGRRGAVGGHLVEAAPFLGLGMTWHRVGLGCFSVASGRLAVWLGVLMGALGLAQAVLAVCVLGLACPSEAAGSKSCQGPSRTPEGLPKG